MKARRFQAKIALLAIGIAACTGNGGDASSPDADPGEPCTEETVHDGEGTYYDADGSGNCGFDPSPGDLLVAAMNQTDYAGSAVCGACVTVSGPIGEVTVRIVDRCPECAPGDLDLSPQAFQEIAALEQGRVPISWTFTPCDVSGPIHYYFKDGSNPYWTAIQVRNHRYAIAALEAQSSSTAGWIALPRLDYNYFVEDAGLGDGPYDLRVTDVHGHVIEDHGVEPGDAVERSGAMQLASCP